MRVERNRDLTSRAAVDALLTRMQQSHANLILVHDSGRHSGNDALPYLIARAHARSPRLRVLLDWEVFDTAHPEIPTAFEAAYRRCLDAVRRYDLDGLCLAGVRYPDRNTPAPAQDKRFRARYGRDTVPSPDDPLWQEWRREQLTAFVRKVAVTLRAARPGWLVTAEGLAESAEARARYGQNWPAWQAEGLVDFVYPISSSSSAAAKLFPPQTVLLPSPPRETRVTRGD